LWKAGASAPSAFWRTAPGSCLRRLTGVAFTEALDRPAREIPAVVELLRRPRPKGSYPWVAAGDEPDTPDGTQQNLAPGQSALLLLRDPAPRQALPGLKSTTLVAKCAETAAAKEQWSASSDRA
jgi:hypothetical protein